MKIEETFYTISRRELEALCEFMHDIGSSPSAYSSMGGIVPFNHRLEDLIKQKRISELKFSAYMEINQNV